MPIAFTIVYDVFPADKRGKMIGLLGAVFGIASVAGPLLERLSQIILAGHGFFI